MADHIGVKRILSVALLAAASACTPVCAQSSLGSITGRLTDSHSHPLAYATVTAHNQSTGVESRTTASRNGSYEFKDLAPGAYSLRAVSPTLGQGEIEGILVSPHHTAHVQVALNMEPTTPTPPPIAASLEPAHATATRPLTTTRIPASEATSPQAATFVLPPRPSIALDYQSVSPVSLHSTGQIAALRLPDSRIPAWPGAAALHPIPHPPIAGGSNRLVLAGPFMIQVAISAARSALRLTAIPRGSLLAVAQAGLQTDDASDVLTSEQLQSLPLRDGDWQSVVVAAADTPEDASGKPRNAAPGSRPTALNMDGMDSRSAFSGNNLAMPGRGRAHFDGPITAESAIRAVRILSPNRVGGNAQSLGGSIAVESRQGGAGLHGRLSILSRQELFAARNPFSQWVRETASAPYAGVPSFTAEPFSPSSQSLRVGAGVGSQFHHGRFGWFTSVDAAHVSEPAVATVRHPEDFFARPSNLQMQVLAARLGLSGVDPVAEGLAAYSPMLEQIAGLLGPTPRASTRITALGRLDWRFSDRQNFTLALSESYWNSPGGGLSNTAEFYGSHSFGSYRGDEQWITGQWRGFLTPNLMLVTQGSFGRYRHFAPPPSPSPFEQSFNINSWNRLPQIIIDSRYGFTMGNPSQFGPGSFPIESNIDVRQQMDWARGQFQLRAGFEFRHGTDSNSLLRNQAGTYHYASIENFISDALSFSYFGLNGQLNPYDLHNCDQTGTVWRDTKGQLHGLGYLPCYSSYSQTIGPSDWWLSTNDWAGYVAASWQPARHLTAAASLRWQREQLPPPITALDNPTLPLTERTPALGNEWAPRFSLAWGAGESWIPVLRVGYGMFYGRTPNLTLLGVLTQTGSPKGDRDFFIRPTDNLYNGGAPPFPYVLAGAPGTSVKQAAVQFNAGFRNPQVHQAALTLEESLPAHFHLEAGASVALARRLPTTIDANFDPGVNPKTITYVVVDGNGSGPIKSPLITVPFYANWPSSSGAAGRLYSDYQRILQIASNANSSWQAGSIQVRRNTRTFTLRVRYTYSHTWDWNPDGSPTQGIQSVFDPGNLQLDYGPSDLDVRHSASGFLLWQSRFHLEGLANHFLNGWLFASTGTYRSGLPYSMRTAGDLPKEYLAGGAQVIGLSYGMNGYGGTRRVYGVGRNTYRYPPTWNADLRLAKNFNMGTMRHLELLAQSFNLFNHSNVTELETVGYAIGAGSPAGGLPTLTFLTGLKDGQTEFGQPLAINATNYYRPRTVQFGIIFRF